MMKFMSLAVSAVVLVSNADLKLIGAQEMDTSISMPTDFLPPVGCVDDGTACELFSTCNNCKCGYSYSAEIEGFVCGIAPCLADETECGSIGSCWQCCNGSFEGNGTICGGECLEQGTTCDSNSTCGLCCNYTSWFNEDHYECGCMADGEACIPGQTCYSCCNGAFNDNGYACGGECMADGTECEYGTDCHMCCGGSSYWFLEDKTACGYESCYADGTSCIPGQNCYNCCNGAYDGDGSICGGTCLEDDTECGFLTTCGKCCNGSKWDSAAETMTCGYPECLANGTSCIPQNTCYNCCSGAHADDGTTCGGECLAEGTECDYYSTCNHCCFGSTYFANVTSYVCNGNNYYYNYDGPFPRPMLSSDNGDNVEAP